jgi:hypothetical protein
MPRKNGEALTAADFLGDPRKEEKPALPVSEPEPKPEPAPQQQPEPAAAGGSAEVIIDERITGLPEVPADPPPAPAPVDEIPQPAPKRGRLLLIVGGGTVVLLAGYMLFRRFRGGKPNGRSIDSVPVQQPVSRPTYRTIDNI